MSPDSRRDQIVSIAARHLAQRGYEGASLNDIAADAGVTRALVYHYFPGKESLLEAVLRRESQALLEATAPDPRASARQNLGRALGAYLDHFSAASGGLRELYTPHARTPSFVWELTSENHVIQVDRLRDFLGLDNSARTRLALGAWLAFVEQVARDVADTSEVGRADALELCVDALEAVVGRVA